MTLGEAIRLVDTLKPNQYSEAQKVAWLSECDAGIWKNIIDTHEHGPETPEQFRGYTTDDMGATLLAAAPHDLMYRYYLEMQIDLYNKEISNYNNTANIYNRAYADFASWYNREHMPRAVATHFRL